MDEIIGALLNILLIGDVVGSLGREVLKQYVPLAREQHDVHFCIANGENAAGGFGLTESTANDLFRAGVDLITSGNHIYDKREFRPYLDNTTKVLRPANYPEAAPGIGSTIAYIDETPIGVLNLMGRVFMPPVDDPFAVGRRHVDMLRDQTPIIILDIHAEASSEKMALARFFDGQVSAVFGTHTHVQTADEQILPGGTAYITDIGMTGPSGGIIGMESGAVIDRFTTAISERMSVVKDGPCQFGALIVSIHPQTGKAEALRRMNMREIAAKLS